jgi:hypothetical protein
MRGRWHDNFNRDSRDFRRNDRYDRDRSRGNRMGGGRFNRYGRSYSKSPVRSPAEAVMMDDLARKDDKEMIKKANSGGSNW